MKIKLFNPIAMRKSFLFLLSTVAFFNLKAQQIPLNNHYFINKFILNPAFTGNSDLSNAYLTHRSQWVGVQGAPQTSYLTIDGSVDKKNIGLGLNLFSDVTDISSRTGAYGSYSYKVNLMNDHSLRLGLSAGIVDYKLDFSRAVYRDKMDPFLMTQTVHKTVFNADFGLAYNWKDLEVGLAVPQMLGNKVNYNINNSDIFFRVERHIVGSLKYVFNIVSEKGITAYPLIVVRSVKGSPVQYDINGIVDWKKLGWLGFSFRNSNSVGVSAGVRYKNLSVGYAYDLGIAGIKAYSGPTNEFLLGFSFGKKEDDATAEKLAKMEMENNAIREDLDKTKAQGDSSKLELAKLRSELDNLKNETKDVIHVNSRREFKDEAGRSPDAGFYIVIGSFSSVDNANKMKAIHIGLGYSNAQIVGNTKTKLYHVYVTRSSNKEDILNELNKVREQYPDAWIQKLE